MIGFSSMFVPLLIDVTDDLRSMCIASRSAIRRPKRFSTATGRPWASNPKQAAFVVSWRDPSRQLSPLVNLQTCVRVNAFLASRMSDCVPAGNCIASWIPNKVWYSGVRPQLRIPRLAKFVLGSPRSGYDLNWSNYRQYQLLELGRWMHVPSLDQESRQEPTNYILATETISAGNGWSPSRPRNSSSSRSSPPNAPIIEQQLSYLFLALDCELVLRPQRRPCRTSVLKN